MKTIKIVFVVSLVIKKTRGGGVVKMMAVSATNYTVEVPIGDRGLLSLSQGIALDSDCIIRTNGVLIKARGGFIAPKCTMIML